tara:strand:- start:121 stop:1086 length:966 start_codon:yes stop_codon:yes gene_type:complete
MKKIIIVCGSGYSGSSAIFDYLKPKCLTPFGDIEFGLLIEPYGIENIYYHFYENFSPNGSSEAIFQFKKYIKSLKNIYKKYKYPFDKFFFNECDKYIKNIISLTYDGIPYYKRLAFSKNEKFKIKLNNLITKKNIMEQGIYQMYLPKNKEYFILETKKFLLKLLNRRNYKNKNILIEQGTSFFKPEIFYKYFQDVKIIKVYRDPRSIFADIKQNKSWPYPENIKEFLKWYNQILKFDTGKKNKKILKIDFEDFIINFQSKKKKINKFLSLKNEKTSKFNIDYSKKNLFIAKKILSIRELKEIKIRLRKFLNWEKYSKSKNV